jgi:3-oxoacyl-[acyl-carrier-protein] synthase-3
MQSTNSAQQVVRSRILGVGSYLPPKIWKNDDLQVLMDTSDEWIQQRTGIKQRHWVEGDVATSDLALEAANRALAAANVKKEEIDMILFATLSPDHDMPGAACFLQAKLGLSGCPAIDLRQQCTGFLYGLSMADQFIRGGMAKKVLLVGAEIHSRGMDRTTRGRDVAILFGDGAGAVIVGATTDQNGPHILSTHLHADGAFAKELWVEAPCHTIAGPRITSELLDRGAHFPKMNGKAVFMHAVRRMPEAIHEALAKNSMKLEDIDLFLFHQANLRINEMVAKQLGIPEEKVFNTIERFGNTTAATLPLGMDEAIKAGKLKPGMTVAMAAFGSGFTWASAIFKW